MFVLLVHISLAALPRRHAGRATLVRHSAHARACRTTGVMQITNSNLWEYT